MAPGDSSAATGSLSASLTADPVALACGRSTDSYAEVIAQRTGMALTNVACGGAVTGSYWASTSFDSVVVPPQREAVTEDNTLVTIQFGGYPHVIESVGPACFPAAPFAPAQLCGPRWLGWTRQRPRLSYGRSWPT